MTKTLENAKILERYKTKFRVLRKLVSLSASVFILMLFCPFRMLDMQQKEKYIPNLIKKLMNLSSLLIMTGQCLSQMEELVVI